MTPLINRNLISRVGQSLTVVVIAAGFFSLGLWQLDRAGALKASLVTATTVDEKNVPLESITQPNITIPPAAINRTVSISGHYVGNFEAPNQVDGKGKQVDLEVALLQIGADEGILIVRGLWSERLLNPEIQSAMVIDITGQLRAHQDDDRAVNSQGVISRLDSAVIVGLSDLNLFDGYVLASSENHDGSALVRTRVLPEKLHSRIPGFYWQHLSYVVIWWLMTGVVLYLPFYRRKVEP